MAGWTADEGMVAVGRAVNAEYVLSGTISRLGGVSMFMAQILRVEDGSIFTGVSRNYGAITDGIFLMEEIAILLTDPANAEERIAELNQRPGREERRRFLASEERRMAQSARQQETERRRLERAARREQRSQEFGASQTGTFIEAGRAKSVRNELELLSLFYGWETRDDLSAVGSSPVPIILPSGIYWSPAPYFVLGLEIKSITFGEEWAGEYIRFRTFAPALGTVVAVGDRGKLFTNFLLEMGNLNERGLLAPGISPGFDLGFIFEPPGALENILTFNVKYRCVFLDGHTTHAIGIGVAATFEAVGRFFSWVGNSF